jgi:hypothetical protein
MRQKRHSVDGARKGQVVPVSKSSSKTVRGGRADEVVVVADGPGEAGSDPVRPCSAPSAPAAAASSSSLVASDGGMAAAAGAPGLSTGCPRLAKYSFSTDMSSPSSSAGPSISQSRLERGARTHVDGPVAWRMASPLTLRTAKPSWKSTCHSHFVQRRWSVRSRRSAPTPATHLDAVVEEAVEHAHGIAQVHGRAELGQKPRQRRQRQLQAVLLLSAPASESSRQAARATQDGPRTLKYLDMSGMYVATRRSNTF